MLKSDFQQYILFLLVLLITNNTVGQRVLLEEKVKKRKRTNYGPNLRHYNHLYLGFGFYSPPLDTDNVEIKYGRSKTFQVGNRYKFKVVSIFDIGLDVSYFYMNFNLKQGEKKTVPNNFQHKNERIVFHNLSSEAFLRINIGHRGNFIGNFIDFATYLNISYSTKHIFTEALDKNSPYNAREVEVVNSKLNYTKPFHYGVRARLGINKYVITLQYRLSDLLNDRFSNELPRFSIGLQLGIHN